MTLTTSFQKIATGSSHTYGAATAYLELWAKYNSQSVENNKSNVTVELRLVVSGGYVGNYQATYWGISGSLSNSGNLGSGDYRSTTLGSATGDIAHNEDGTKSVSFSGYFNPTAWDYEITVSGSADLPTIDRYAEFETQPAASNITEKTATISYTADRTLFAAQYKIKKATESSYGDWITIENAASSFNLQSLDIGESYKVIVRIEGYDNNLWRESDELTFSTLDSVIYTKVSDSWKKAVPYVNVNGTWKKAIPYQKINGTWKYGVN